MPILVNGILYVTTPNNVWALDARSAHPVWHYTYPPNQGLHIGHRGVDVYNDSVYFTTPDAHLISRDARDGKVKWDVVSGDVKKGYWTTMAPLVIRDLILVGTSGDFDNLTGMLKSMDPETGDTQWTFYSTLPRETPEAFSGGATGGKMWITGTYDPGLYLRYGGTGKPTPGPAAPRRPRGTPLTRYIVALKPT